VIDFTQFQQVYQKYNLAGFEVIVFPCNQFWNQQPAENYELLNVLKYVRPGGNYTPSFYLSQQLLVNGAGEDPIFTYLKGSCGVPQVQLFTPTIIEGRLMSIWSPVLATDVTWNFEKWLIDRNGMPYKRYNPATDPMTLSGDIEYLLNKK